MATSGSGYLSRGAEVVRKAENDLGMLISEAALGGEFEAVTVLGAWAKSIKSLAGRNSASVPGGTAGSGVVGAPGPFPRFFRIDDKLVMVGRSKKTGKKYDHRVPKIVLDQLVAFLLKGAEANRPVNVDEILQGLDAGNNGGAYPKYYAQTLLRWLRALSFVTKHGHQGYIVSDRELFVSDVGKKWGELPTKVRLT